MCQQGYYLCLRQRWFRYIRRADPVDMTSKNINTANSNEPSEDKIIIRRDIVRKQNIGRLTRDTRYSLWLRDARLQRLSRTCKNRKKKKKQTCITMAIGQDISIIRLTTDYPPWTLIWITHVEHNISGTEQKTNKKKKDFVRDVNGTRTTWCLCDGALYSYYSHSWTRDACNCNWFRLIYILCVCVFFFCRCTSSSRCIGTVVHVRMCLLHSSPIWWHRCDRCAHRCGQYQPIPIRPSIDLLYYKAVRHAISTAQLHIYICPIVLSVHRAPCTASTIT